MAFFSEMWGQKEKRLVCLLVHTAYPSSFPVHTMKQWTLSTLCHADTLPFIAQLQQLCLEELFCYCIVSAMVMSQNHRMKCL